MLDRIIGFSVHHRWLMVLLTALLTVWGGLAWRQLNLDAVPDITTNQVAINTQTGGMGPEEVERAVTFPIETAMAGLPGVENVRSLSQYGLSQVTVTFRDDIDTYFARQLVNERLNGVGDELPDGVGTPQMGPVSTGLGDIYMYTLESDTRSPMDLRSLQDWTIAPQLRTVAGVAEVNAADGSERQYQVVLDHGAMRAHGIAIDEIRDALARNNQNRGGGVLETGGHRILIRSVGMATSLADIERIPVRSERGVPLLIRDIATVKLGTPTLTGISTKDGRETMLGVVMMLKGANGRTVARAVDARVEQIRAQLPKDVRLTTVYDRSHLVEDVLHTVQKSLLEGAALVIAVLVLLLGNIRAALVVATAIPLAMICAVIGMQRFGISGNLMSLGAIDFGLIVDGAVVMIENAVRRVAEAREHKGVRLTRAEVRDRVYAASREVAKPTVYAVAIITVVYLPVLALEGTEGKMFRPMAFTVVFALLGALALTLTLIPTLAGWVLSGDTREGRNRIMSALARAYDPVLNFALRHRGAVLGLAGVLLVAAGITFTRLGSEFIPQLDEGSIVIQPVRVRTVDAEQTVKLVTAFERRIRTVPEVQTVFSRSGTPEVATDPMPLSLTDSFVMLKPRHQWRPGMTKERLREELEAKAAEVPGQGYNFTQPIQMRFSELVSGVKADIGIKVFGEDLPALRRAADEIADLVREIPGAADVEVEQVEEVPVLEARIDRDAAAQTGVSVDAIQALIGAALGSEPVGQIVEGDRRYPLVMRLSDAVRNDPEAIKRLPVETSTGALVDLESVARVALAQAPAQISRESGKRRVVVQLNVRGRDTGSFVDEAQRRIAQRVELPEGTYLEWGGQFENMQRASNRLMVVVPLALALILGLLYSTFGSLRQALIIFSGVPLAATGGILALGIRGLPFSITAGVGFIALSGVAVMNGVVMVSAINRNRAEGMDVRQAVWTGARERLRPVLMTALVAALGFVPMALNTGIGAEVQRPLATVVIGGILTATSLTLVVLPVLYRWIEERADR